MPKTKKTPFSPWETTKPNGIEERYIRMGNSQMLHPAIQNLGHAAFRVYTHMKLESAGRPEFKFPHAKWKKFISPGGFQSAKAELCGAGLIEVVESNANLRKPNVYRFSEAWKRATLTPPPLAIYSISVQVATTQMQKDAEWLLPSEQDKLENGPTLSPDVQVIEQSCSKPE